MNINIALKHSLFVKRKASERDCSEEEYVASLIEEEEALEVLEGTGSKEEVDAAWANEIRARRRTLESGEARIVMRAELEERVRELLRE